MFFIKYPRISGEIKHKDGIVNGISLLMHETYTCDRIIILQSKMETPK